MLKLLRRIFSKLNYLFFVGSTDILPEPFNKEEEEKYVNMFLNGDMTARDKLIEHNLRLVVFLAKKYENTKIDLEDLVSIGTIGLIKGVNTYQNDKNIKLATYASRCIDNEILMYLRKTKKKRTEVSFEDSLSFDSEGNIRAQNRGAYLYLPGSGQWKKLGDWLAPRIDMLFEILSDKFILFGEWCYAQHSISYDRLPDWFLGFDIYDKRFGRFLSSERRDALLREMCISQVPIVARGRFTYPEIQKILSVSKFSDQPAEGIYLRVDQGDWLAQRAKLVRPAFIQAVETHWTRSAIRPNRLSLELQG